MKLKKIILLMYLFIGTLALQPPSLAEEKIEVTPLIQLIIFINYWDNPPCLKAQKDN